MKVIPGRRREFEISVVVDVEAADDYMRGASNPALDLCCWMNSDCEVVVVDDE
jgi:hypothetical protein